MIMLKADNEYEMDFFNGGLKEIKIENHSLYGRNETRNDLKIVEFNGFMIHNVSRIVVDSGDSIVFKLYNSLGEIMVEYIMKIYEKLVIKNTSLGTLKYSFVEG